MIERLELNEDFPGYFGLGYGGIWAVRAGLGGSSWPSFIDAEEKYKLYRQTFKRTDDYYIRMRENIAAELDPRLELPVPMWFDATKESAPVISGLSVYASHNRLPSDLTPSEHVRLQIAAVMAGRSITDQVVGQTLSSMQAEELISQIQGYGQYLGIHQTET